MEPASTTVEAPAKSTSTMETSASSMPAASVLRQGRLRHKRQRHKCTYCQKNSNQ
jgi:hypothetical protein